MNDATTFDKQRERRLQDERWKALRKAKAAMEHDEEKRLLDVAYRNWESARMTDAERERITASLQGRSDA